MSGMSGCTDGAGDDGFALLLLLLEEAGSDSIYECDMLLKVCQKYAVGGVPLSILSTDSDDRFAEELDSFVGSLVSFVVAKFIGFIYLPLFYHVLCSMPLGLCDGDGSRRLGSGMSVIHMPHIPITLECPRSFGKGAG